MILALRERLRIIQSWGLRIGNLKARFWSGAGSWNRQGILCRSGVMGQCLYREGRVEAQMCQSVLGSDLLGGMNGGSSSSVGPKGTPMGDSATLKNCSMASLKASICCRVNNGLGNSGLIGSGLGTGSALGNSGVVRSLECRLFPKAGVVGREESCLDVLHLWHNLSIDIVFNLPEDGCLK